MCFQSCAPVLKLSAGCFWKPVAAACLFTTDLLTLNRLLLMLPCLPLVLGLLPPYVSAGGRSPAQAQPSHRTCTGGEQRTAAALCLWRKRLQQQLRTCCSSNNAAASCFLGWGFLGRCCCLWPMAGCNWLCRLLVQLIVPLRGLLLLYSSHSLTAATLGG